MGQAFIDVGQPGTEFLRAAFERGLHLGREVASKLDLSSGRCLAIVPEGADPGAVADFNSGGLAVSGDTLAELAEFLQAEMSRNGRVLVAENAMARPDDPEFPDDPIERFSFGEEIYEYVGSAPASANRIERLIRLADAGYSLNAVLTRANLTGHLPIRRGPITRDDLKLLADGAELLVARAYDGESFLLWRS